MAQLRYGLLVGLLVLADYATVQAAPRVPLEPGMGYAQVRALWGAPAEEAEREVQRAVYWSYSGGEAVFKEGVLASWRSDRFPQQQPQPAALPTPHVNATSGTHLSAQKAGFDDEIVGEILQEISKQSDAGETVVAGGGQNNFPPMPPAPSFAIPTPFGFGGAFPFRPPSP